MKKILAVFIAAAMLGLVGGCGGGKGETKEVQKPIEKQNKVLVAYFSASGNTEKVAKNMAAVLGADIYKIEPQVPYTDADLNYNDKSSRVCKEHDAGTQPAVGGNKIANMSQYDVVVLGYPIWWGEAPGVVHSFLKTYDLAGKTIVPFCTSGGSGFGASGSKLAKAFGKATWQEGGQLSPSASKDTLTKWAKDHGLKVK